ncbi:type II toxin-antitoxin system VapC family toxin [Jiella pelagia]|uniref:Type II toxin-antitoxin system VapC family toxin n=1 Tax=Jiella pelagia TaxID=2986949 RepID=A0ABY7C8I7_9HYPH|nr:type II toxin-antitoxin system VapC family toxin [Jiella pelagia]WAP71359.1 type II toxin-antitoxin system VapC family toxin [Jiella pelagia]
MLAWWLLNDPKLSRPAALAITEPENEIFVSAVSASRWRRSIALEMAEVAPLIGNFGTLVKAEDFKILPLNHSHALLAGQLPGLRKDPFNRLLAAQARQETLILITADAAIARLGIQHLS